MLAVALRSGIELDYVRSLIKKFAISAESSEVDPWPWPVKIFTLGRFAIVIEDLTARELRVPGGAATEHANGATGIAAVTIGAVDVADTEWRYATLRERGAPQVALRKAERDGLLDVRYRAG